jgi:hypothetical protein
VLYILQMFSEHTVSGPADIMSVFSFGSHVVEQVGGNCNHCISCPPSKFRQSGSQWWHTSSLLDVSSKENVKGSNVRWTRWPINFSGNLDVRSPSLPCGNVEALRLVGTACHRDPPKIGMRNSSNMCRFIMPARSWLFYLGHHFNNYECCASGGKIWKLKQHEL